MKNRLFRFFDDVRWAEQMLSGSLRFRSLSYYKAHEDQAVRGDPNEGNSVFRPDAGLSVTKNGQHPFVWLDSAFEAEVKGDEIFVYCLTRRDTPRIRAAFKAVACVEIVDPKEFYQRVTKALNGVVLGGKPGRARLAKTVEYYRPSDPPGIRWACPDLIACAKWEAYKWQDEVRLMYTRTDAFAFENAKFILRKGSQPGQAKNAGADICEYVEVGSLADIASLRVIPGVTCKSARNETDNQGPTL